MAFQFNAFTGKLDFYEKNHSKLINLLVDTHTQYALLAGRSGGQTIIGGTGTTDKLILRATSGVGADGSDIILQVGNNGATEVFRAKPAYIETPDYLNSGGSGDRTGVITATAWTSTDAVWTLNEGTPSMFVNGTLVTPQVSFSAVAVADRKIRFDFGAGASKIIDEAKWYMTNTTTHGIWQWQGSDDAVSWTNIGATFTLGGATIQTQTTLNGNTTGYRYYRLLGISGTTSASPYNTELEFKIGNATAVGDGNIGIQNTTPSAYLHLKAGSATQNTAPLKFTSGPLNSMPEVGAVEFLTDNLYLTTTTQGVRKKIVFDTNAAFLGNTSFQTAGNVSMGTTVSTSHRLMIVGGGATGFSALYASTGDVGEVRLCAHVGVWQGLYVSASGSSTYSVQVVGTKPFYINGPKLGIGVVPTAFLHLKAGTATANTAPLKFNSGTLLTTAEAGAVEFLTDKFYGTITTGAARTEFTLNNAALTSGKIPIATTNGRLTDGQTPLTGTKIYYVADTSGGAVTRKLTFIDGILTAEV